MKIKDLLKFNPEAEIIVTVEREGFSGMGAVSFMVKSCKDFVFKGAKETGVGYVEMTFTEKKHEKKKASKRNHALGEFD